VPERPLLNLPDPESITPRPGPRGGPKIVGPGRGRQGERMAPRFGRLMNIIRDPDRLLGLRNDPSSIAPERAIVFEVVSGMLKDFYAQAQALGLEYLGDFEEDFAPDEDFYEEGKPEKPVTGCVYLAMPDVRALQELLNLWQRYLDGARMPPGRGAWRELFDNLLDVRPWGPQDRVLAETIVYWRESLEAHRDEPVRFEVELWFHENAGRRTHARQRLETQLREIGGTIIHHVTIRDIRYDAALVDVPPAGVEAILDNPTITLARVDDVMFLRPQSVAAFKAREELEGEDGEPVPTEPGLADRAPIVAMLDGLPIQNHVKLAGRLIVDDPDEIEARYPVAERRHGTEMASLIIHGDLNDGPELLPRPLFVLPVMRPNQRGDERTPADRLLVDMIYGAVRRIKVGDGNAPASAPEVKVINLSLADQNRPFARVMSPLGRLLDYLSYRYGVLFLVSGGNIGDHLRVPDYATSAQFEGADPEEREQAVLLALDANKSHRTIYSPGEAVNILTIGAAHKGSGFNGGFPPNLIDPFTDERLPNIVSALGLGHRKVVKPDLLLDGGRAPVRVVGTGEQVTIAPVNGSARLFGLKAATPNRVGGDRYEDYTWGTSVATALATRAAHRIHDVLLDANGGSNHADIAPEYMPLVLKVLLVHSASWSERAEAMDATFQPQGRGSHFARRDNIVRLLGYGVPDIERVLDCAENRATLLGYGLLEPERGALYRIPLPLELDGQRALRFLTVTLAWFSPVNSRHQGYRMAALDVTPGNTEDKYWITSKRLPNQPTDKAVTRGTLFHERRQGEEATVFVDDGHILLRVSCRSAAGELEEAIPYALAVSFEVAVDANIAVYDSIRERLAAKHRAEVAPRA